MNTERMGAATPVARAMRRRVAPAGKAGVIGVAALAVIGVVAAGALGALPQIEQQIVAEQTPAAASADIPPAYLAAYQRAAAAARPPIPWTILAAVGKVATDHGRLSPYDGVARDGPAGTDSPDVVPPIAGPARPGGQGQGGNVSGPSPGGGPGPGTELATDVNALPTFLAGERHVESNGNYTASSGGASGAYQFIGPTWASEAVSAGYPQYAGGTAAAAPPAVQDAVATYDALHLFAALHSWYWAAEAWYYPLWAANPSQQDAVPYPNAGNALTMAGYARAVYAAMEAATGRAQPPTEGTQPGSPVGTGPLLLTADATVAPGADLQAVETEADLLTRAAAPIEEQTWRRLGLPSSVVDEPLSAPDSQRFWTQVLGRLPVAAGVGIGRVSTGDDGYVFAGPAATGRAAPEPPPTASSAAPGPGSAHDPMDRFAADLLTNLTLPVTVTNLAALHAWASGEGSAAAFNPLDTTQVSAGATAYNANDGHPVEQYPDYRTGLAATVATLAPGGHPAPMYQGILATLQAGTSTTAVEAAVAASPWGTHRFPDPHFTAAANFPGWPASVPPGPLRLTDLAAPLPAATDGTVHAGTDAHAGADELTMAEYYAGVIASATPAAGSQYTPSNTLGPGFTVAAGTPAAAATAVHTALAQLGKPYVFGATGPGSYDCSGLVMAAYAAGGVPLPRTTYAQVLAGRAVPTGSAAALRPGDLLFVMGSDPQGSAPGHVGMYVGGGQVVDAPYTGAVVHLSPLSSWLPQLVAVRRVAG